MYKRQTIGNELHSVENIKGFYPIVGKNGKENIKILIDGDKISTVIPVSYTHLDVYKRQGRRIWIGRFAGSSLREESTYPAKENSHTGRAAEGQSAGGHSGKIAGWKRRWLCSMG